MQLLELEEIPLWFRRVIARFVYPTVIPTPENFCHLVVSQPEGHQWIAAANLIDLPKLPESRRDRFASSAERCFIGATVRKTVRLESSRRFDTLFLARNITRRLEHSVRLKHVRAFSSVFCCITRV